MIAIFEFVRLRDAMHRCFRSVLVLMFMVLGGCAEPDSISVNSTPSGDVSQAAQPVAPPPLPSEISTASTTTRTSLSIDQCRKALDSLRVISPATYRQKKAYFDSLVTSVSQYSSVRGEVGVGTRDTVDALYKFKTGQVCAEIEHQVMNALVRRIDKGSQ